MALSVLSLQPDDDVFDISKAEEHMDARDADMELPGQYTLSDDLDVLVDGALALESIYDQITKNGIDYDTAKNINGIIAGMNRGGLGLESTETFIDVREYTNYKSIEGLYVANESIKETVVNALKKIFEKIKEVFESVSTLIKTRFSGDNIEKFKNIEAAARIKKTANLDNLIRLLEETNKKPEQTAGEVARMAGGEIGEFTASLDTEFTKLAKRMEDFVDAVSANRVAHRLATGNLSIGELLKSQADDVITKTVAGAWKELNDFVKLTNDSDIAVGVDKMNHLLDELTEIATSTMDTDKDTFDGSSEDIKLSTIVTNLVKASDAMESIDVTVRITSFMKTAEIVRVASDGLASKDLANMFGDDVDGALKARAISAAVAVSAKIAALGQASSKLWQERYDAMVSTSKTLNGIYVIMNIFKGAIERSSSTLEQDQKDKLKKALLSKGVAVEL